MRATLWCASMAVCCASFLVYCPMLCPPLVWCVSLFVCYSCLSLCIHVVHRTFCVLPCAEPSLYMLLCAMPGCSFFVYCTVQCPLLCVVPPFLCVLLCCASVLCADLCCTSLLLCSHVVHVPFLCVVTSLFMCCHVLCLFACCLVLLPPILPVTLAAPSCLLPMPPKGTYLTTVWGCNEGGMVVRPPANTQPRVRLERMITLHMTLLWESGQMVTCDWCS